MNAQRYKAREYIRDEMIREVARLWQHDESSLAIEGFDPLVEMLLGAFAHGLEGVYHEMDDSASRMMARLARLLVPDALTGPRPAHAVLRTGIIDPNYEVMPLHSFTANASGREFAFSATGQYALYKVKLATTIVQSRVKEMGASPRESFLDQALPPNQVWLGLEVDPELEAFDHLSLFFDWRNDPDRSAHLARLSGIRMFTDAAELRLAPGLVDARKAEREEVDLPEKDLTEALVERHYRRHFYSLSNRHAQTDARLPIQRQKYPEAVGGLAGAEDLAKIFQDDLFWVRLEWPDGLTPEALSRMIVEVNAFPVVNRRADASDPELRPLFNVFPIRLEPGEQFLGMIAVESPSGAKLTEAQAFSRDHAQQYLLRQRGVTRFDERDASALLAYLTELLRDESAAFKAVGQTELDTDIEEIRNRLERIDKALRRDNFPHWFVTVKTADREGKMNLKYWATKGAEANNIALGVKLNRDRANPAFTDEMTQLLTTTQGGRYAMTDDESLPTLKQALLSRGRLVTFEDYKAACRAELGDLIRAVSVRKGFAAGHVPAQGLLPTLEIRLIPNPARPLPVEQWEQQREELLTKLEAQSSGILPLCIVVEGLNEKAIP